MSTHEFDPSALRRPLAVLQMALVTSLLSACGGGGGGSAPAPAPAPAAATTTSLSANQMAYQSFVLTQNGGQHALEAQLGFNVSGGQITPTAGDYFFTEDYSLARAPTTAGTEALNVGATTLVAAFGVPTASAHRFLIDGAIVAAANPQILHVGYSGADVQITAFAVDGTTITQTLLGTGYSVVPLSGLIQSSPAELFADSALGVITNTINGTSLYTVQSSWQSGSAYMKVVRQQVGNSIQTTDCAAPTTTGTAITPCAASSALAGFFPYASTMDQAVYNLSDGQVQTQGSTQVWIANSPINSAFEQTPTVMYRVFYLISGEVYQGELIKDGTVLEYSPFGGAGVDFTIFLNSAAVQSVQSAITF